MFVEVCRWDDIRALGGVREGAGVDDAKRIGGGVDDMDRGKAILWKGLLESKQIWILGIREEEE